MRNEIEKTIISDKNGKILENKLYQIIYGRAATDKDKSAIETIAHYTKVCGLREVDYSSNFCLLDYKEKIMTDSRELYYLIALMSVTGLRISEALTISPHDISNDGRVRIKSLKGSDIRIIQDSECSVYLKECKAKAIIPFRTFDRFFVYRYLKKLGIGSYFGDNKNKSVTHLFRHLAILDMKEIDPKLEATKKVIGHKSIKSTEHYGNNQKTSPKARKRDN